MKDETHSVYFLKYTEEQFTNKTDLLIQRNKKETYDFHYHQSSTCS